MAQASPKVMIVGAGLGGLVLGILLEKMGIEYDIFERSAVCKPYGTRFFLSSHFALARLMFDFLYCVKIKI